MSNSEYLTFKELVNVIEKSIHDNYWVAADFILEALTAWPVEDPYSVDQLLSDLKTEVNLELTYDNLLKYYNKLDLNSQSEMWKHIAVSSLLELYDFERNSIFDRDGKLENIVKQITLHYRKT